MGSLPEHKRGPGFERRVLVLGFVSGLPGTVLALILLWSSHAQFHTKITITLVFMAAWAWLVFRLRERILRPIQTLSNMMAALLEGDYSIRSPNPRPEDALGLAFRELNALGQTLREQRLGALDATSLLRKVMEEVEVAVFVFDPERRLRLVNRAGEKVLARPSERLLGAMAKDLALDAYLDDDGPRTIEATLPGRAGRWEVRSTTFRQAGLPHRLLILTDLSRALREEERQAWQRLVRVLGHEINNSLTPIISIARSLRDQRSDATRGVDLEKNVDRGLDVIAGRAEALHRFLSAHARLAQLPPPRLGLVDVGTWVERVVALESRGNVDIEPGPPTGIRADGDQLDQVLINLVRNAIDASAETNGRVRVSWSLNHDAIEVRVEDEGQGLPETANLFVPFFTTKPNGSGIGLVLSRQIAEAHGGSLVLENREGASGCVSRLRLPIRG